MNAYIFAVIQGKPIAHYLVGTWVLRAKIGAGQSQKQIDNLRS